MNTLENKLFIAKMLPEMLIIADDNTILWRPETDPFSITDDVSFEELAIPVLETEWLNIMQLVEEKIDRVKNILNPANGENSMASLHLRT